MTNRYVSKKLRFEILHRDQFACRYCGAKAPNVELEVDHITPVHIGGTSDPANLITACHSCNSGKNGKVITLPLDGGNEQKPTDELVCYSIADVSRRTSLSPATIYRRLDDGSIRSIKNGHRRLIPSSELRKLVGL